MENTETLRYSTQDGQDHLETVRGHRLHAIHNTSASEPFTDKTGVRQGYLLLPLISFYSPL